MGKVVYNDVGDNGLALLQEWLSDVHSYIMTALVADSLATGGDGKVIIEDDDKDINWHRSVKANRKYSKRGNEK